MDQGTRNGKRLRSVTVLCRNQPTLTLTQTFCPRHTASDALKDAPAGVHETDREPRRTPHGNAPAIVGKCATCAALACKDPPRNPGTHAGAGGASQQGHPMEHILGLRADGGNNRLVHKPKTGRTRTSRASSATTRAEASSAATTAYPTRRGSTEWLANTCPSGRAKLHAAIAIAG